jgi:hypothetical protein
LASYVAHSETAHFGFPAAASDHRFTFGGGIAVSGVDGDQQRRFKSPLPAAALVPPCVATETRHRVEGAEEFMNRNSRFLLTNEFRS